MCFSNSDDFNVFGILLIITSLFVFCEINNQIYSLPYSDVVSHHYHHSVAIHGIV